MSKDSLLAVNIGLAEDDREAVSEALSRVLADAYALYLKTHAAHWNVTGSMFNSLHAMFEEQYTEQWHALDELAERIRALRFFAPGSQGEYARLSSLDDSPSAEDSSNWRALVRTLLQDNEGFCLTASAALDKAAQVGDEPTADLMTKRLQVHQKNAWMLRSLLQGD